MRTSAKGKQRRVYRWYATPWEILRQLPDVARHLRSGIIVTELERIARAESDTQAARKMQEAKGSCSADCGRGGAHEPGSAYTPGRIFDAARNSGAR